MDAIFGFEFRVSHKENILNLFSLLSLLAFMVYIHLGLYAYHLEPKSRLNRMLLVLCLNLGLWAFAYSFVYSAPNKEVLWIWFKISAIGWCTVGGIGLHFMLILSQKGSILKRPWIYLLLYGPGLILLVKAWTGVLTAKDFVPTPLGWGEVLAVESPWLWIHVVNYSTCMVIGIFLTFQWGQRSKNRREIKQAYLIGGTIGLIFLIGTILNILWPALKMKPLPASAQILILIWAYGIWVAINKYRFMVFSAAIASDEIISRMKNILILTDAEGNFLRINPQAEKLLSYKETELLGKPLGIIFKDEEIVSNIIEGIANRSLIPDRKVDCQTKAGELIPVHLSCSIIKDNIEEVFGLVIVAEDMRPTLRLTDEITVRIRAEEALIKIHEEQENRIQERTEALFKSNKALQEEIEERKEMEKLFKTLFMRSPIGSYIAQDGMARIINPELMKTTGFSEEELMTIPTLGLVHPDDRAKVRNKALEMLRGERLHPYEFRIQTKDGRIRWILETVTSIRFQGRPATLASFLDITHRKESEDTIRQLAYYDSLTGLPNRVLFLDRLTLALIKAERDEENLTIMMIDVDKFKEINDTFGHNGGDLLLKEIGQRLTGFLRKSDTVARLGGDEFVALLPETGHEDDIGKIADKILDEIQKPLSLDGRSVQATISIGLAFYPKDGQTVELLLKNADRAMYRAKELGRNNYQVFDLKAHE